MRLPSHCGTGPFARIAEWDTARDQSIPAGSVADTKLKLRKRGLPVEVVQATLDYDFALIPESYVALPVVN